MALQVCVTDETAYAGVAADGSAALCPACGGNAWRGETEAVAVPDEHMKEPAPVLSVPALIKPIGAAP